MFQIFIPPLENEKKRMNGHSLGFQGESLADQILGCRRLV